MEISGLRILSPDIQRTIDFSLFKHFRITESSRLQFRFKVFNLPNTPSFAAPNPTLDTAIAGRVDQHGDGSTPDAGRAPIHFLTYAGTASGR